MDYMEVFLKCIEGDIDTSKASQLIRQQADALLLSGKVKEYEKAVLCLTYFIRYHQYNTGKITYSGCCTTRREQNRLVCRRRWCC